MAEAGGAPQTPLAPAPPAIWASSGRSEAMAGEGCCGVGPGGGRRWCMGAGDAETAGGGGGAAEEVGAGVVAGLAGAGGAWKSGG